MVMDTFLMISLVVCGMYEHGVGLKLCQNDPTLLDHVGAFLDSNFIKHDSNNIHRDGLSICKIHKVLTITLKCQTYCFLKQSFEVQR